MQWNPLDGIGRKRGDPARRGNELWKWMAYVPVEIKEIKKKKTSFIFNLQKVIQLIRSEVFSAFYTQNRHISN